ncbi:MAG: hypothetical protein ABR595_00480 [Psychroflexus sp.]
MKRLLLILLSFSFISCSYKVMPEKSFQKNEQQFEKVLILSYLPMTSSRKLSKKLYKALESESETEIELYAPKLTEMMSTDFDLNSDEMGEDVFLNLAKDAGADLVIYLLDKSSKTQTIRNRFGDLQASELGSGIEVQLIDVATEEVINTTEIEIEYNTFGKGKMMKKASLEYVSLLKMNNLIQ